MGRNGILRKMETLFSKKVCFTPMEIERRLKSVSIQPTTQRISICRYVLCEADHPTAEEVKEWVDSRSFKMSLATVYNTLNLLVSAGLLREFKFSCLGKSVYDSNIVNHYHFFDVKSGKFHDIDPSLLSLSSHLPAEFQVDKTDILLTGNLIR
ncbi:MULTISPECIES: peroxide-responsive transcriptional repressor PerRB [Leptospira]|uniref:Ferric uptake regulation protein n=6 Tax=Leptospira santarosai TaxID=28183 RepID=A0AB73MPF2_9LEPT|nr:MULTISPECIES: transcriptional repressor [Leptospira]EMO58814.1 ferric uptake regulator family protein [Leptospira santarosai str. CBC1416]ASV11256.1 transcriptional repressor [Leptospira santarosai]AVV79344.1 Ferric uptake regulator family protein [Leptospira santarosai]EKO34626.1 ferric uptake regulator family protein [Leptospira santarosai str. MOR084]EKO76542.1 ferric uptake regulator family protein [Leptospira sp. Fiocruz LV3954]